MADFYDDLFLRLHLRDNGSRPAADPVYTSPDIIPWGVEPVSNPQNTFANFGIDYGRTVTWGVRNYIYSRATNLSSGSSSGELQLYWTKATLINYPFTWKDNQISSAVRYEAPYMGQQVVGAQPFVWTPQMSVGANDHVCLISRMVTRKHPNEIPEASNISDFAAWLRQERGFAWRNIAVQGLPQYPAGSRPDWTFTVDYQQGTATAPVLAKLVAENIPLGSRIGFACPTVAQLNMSPQTVTAAYQASGVYTSPIPAGTRAKVTVELWLSANRPPVPNVHTALAFDADYVPASRAEAATLGALPLHQGRLANYLIDVTGLDADQPAVGVGSFQMHTPYSAV
jgi:hypothetical protein